MKKRTSQKKRTDPSWEKIPNPTPDRPHPFSEEELNKFHLRAAARVKKMKESIRETVEDHKKPLSERRKV